MAKPDYDFWDEINCFRITHAAWLWLDEEPEPDTDETPAQVAAIKDMLRDHVAYWLENGMLSIDDDNDMCFPPMERISRNALRDLAEVKKCRPPFLFFEERAEAPGNQRKRKADAKENDDLVVGLLLYLVQELSNGKLSWGDNPHQTHIAQALFEQMKKLHIESDAIKENTIKNRFRVGLTAIKHSKTLK